MATQAILDAAIQFCDASLAIYRELDPIILEPGRKNYPLEATSQQQVARVKRAFINGQPLDLFGQAGIAPDLGGMSMPRKLHVVQTIFGPELILTPTPDAAYELRIEAALRPRRTAQALDPDLLEIWVDAIVAGAVSYAQRIPAQPFSDPASAAQRYAEFRSHISRARMDGPINRINSTLRVRARPFA